MIDRFLKDTVNLLIYGGAFIGLCAACITALTFELAGLKEENLRYIFLIGSATAALYSIHRIIGLKKTAFLITDQRFNIIRQYQSHIRVYAILWLILSGWLILPLLSLKFILWVLPGALIGWAYVIPFLPGGRRLRDLGWGKILMIAWSWSWLTAVVPMGYFADASIQMMYIHGVERLLFILLLTIPFEIRDLKMDKSLGLRTMPERLGVRRTRRLAWVFVVLTIILSFLGSFHYLNPAYVMAMALASFLTILLIVLSYKINHDYFFAGVVDGMMILVLWFFLAFKPFADQWIGI